MITDQCRHQTLFKLSLDLNCLRQEDTQRHFVKFVLPQILGAVVDRFLDASRCVDMVHEHGQSGHLGWDHADHLGMLVVVKQIVSRLDSCLTGVGIELGFNVLTGILVVFGCCLGGFPGSLLGFCDFGNLFSGVTSVMESQDALLVELTEVSYNICLLEPAPILQFLKLRVFNRNILVPGLDLGNLRLKIRRDFFALLLRLRHVLLWSHEMDGGDRRHHSGDSLLVNL